MAATKYTYSIAADIVGAQFNSDTLKSEIEASSIVTAIDRIDATGDVLDVWFKDALSAGDKTTLDNDTTGPSGGIIGNHDGTPTSTVDPHTSDGKPIVLPNMFPPKIDVVFIGSGDDVANGVQYDGPLFQITSSTADSDTSLETQSIKHVLLAGGGLHGSGAKVADRVSFEVYAPATAGTSNPGAGAYDKFPTGLGFNIYVPNGTVTGGWDLNLAETLNANVSFTKVVPVPNSSKTGFFDFNKDNNQVTMNPTQTGSHDLYDAAIPLARWAANIPITDSGLTVPAVNPKGVLPHWIYKTTLHHGPGTHEVDIGWYLYQARKGTA